MKCFCNKFFQTGSYLKLKSRGKKMLVASIIGGCWGGDASMEKSYL